MSTAILVCALTALSSGEAPPRNAVALDVGVASAVGEVGVTYAFRVLTALEVEVGLGWGYSGAQASVMPKLSFGTSAHRVTTGAGLANTFAASAITRGNPTWLNVDVLGYEYRSPGHLFLSAAAGFFWGVSGGTVCTGDCEGGNQHGEAVTRLVRPQGRLAAGLTF
jgi:hypothetical protein